MPVYRLQGPDGRVYKVEGPDGATAEQLGSFIVGQISQQQKPKTPEPSYDPTEGMSGLDKFRAGMGKSMVDLARGAGQLVGLVNRDDIAESRRLDAALMNSGTAKAGNLLGSIATTAPLAMVPGANTLAGGATIGALTGLLQPSTSTAETAANAVLGGGAGALVPATVRGYQIGKSMIAPFSEKGRQQIVGETLRKAAGSEVEPALYRLQSAVTAGPLVPGVIPTAAEVAQNPGLAALQRTATAVDPIAMNNAATRQVMNNDARIAALQKMQGDIPALTQARDDAVNQLYRDSFKSTVEIDPGIKSLLKRPVMQQAMERAKTLAANNGESLDFVKAMPSQASQILNSAGEPAFRTAATPGSMSGKAAHYMKQALDDMSNAAPATGIAGNELRAVQGTLKDFLGAVEAQVPEYGMARRTYAAMSQPINQSQVIDEIVKRSMANIKDNLTPAAFNRAFSDRTVRDVTGRATATLENTLTPAQLSDLKNIRESLKGLDYAQTAGKGVGSDTVQKMAMSNMLDKAGIPQWIRSVGPSGIVGGLLQRGGQLAYADANRNMSELLARALLEPQMTSLLMQRAAPKTGLLNYGGTASRAGAATLPRGLLSTFQAEE